MKFSVINPTELLFHFLSNILVRYLIRSEEQSLLIHDNPTGALFHIQFFKPTAVGRWNMLRRTNIDRAAVIF